jgi:hypothetical protein
VPTAVDSGANAGTGGLLWVLVSLSGAAAVGLYGRRLLSS